MAEINTQTPVLDAETLRKMDRYWRACNYLAAGMIYLRDNPLLREPLKPEHIKRRLLGHWGSDPGQSFLLVHLNRLIRKLDLNVMYIAGPGHGAPATLANSYLEGHYSEIYPDRSEDEAGMLRFFRQFSFPGGIGRHCTPETPGSIHEGGELGYSLSHGYGAAFDNPDLIVAVMVGDGEAETGPLATSWHSNKFLNPIRDGAVLPILHLNGYKIANPTILARIPREELEALADGLRLQAVFRRRRRAATRCTSRWPPRWSTASARSARSSSRRATAARAERPRWPMIVLRSPKGWTGPKEVDGHKVEGSWRAHQVPVLDPATNEQEPATRRRLDAQLQARGAVRRKRHGSSRSCANSRPKDRAASAPIRTPTAALLRKPLDLPRFRDYAVEVEAPGCNLHVADRRARQVSARRHAAQHDQLPRVRPGRNRVSNRLKRSTRPRRKPGSPNIEPEDADGGEMALDGRVMEMLSEHTLEGWFEGYVLTGRHGLFATYEAFVHVIDSMFNQHAKWLEKSKHELGWRRRSRRSIC